MSSGLLAETVLVHFDDSVAGTPAARYVRYVDDIRLFGRSSEDLREPLMLLDLCSKQVGLFPQTAKTSIQRVKDIEDEIKTLSEPGGTPPVALSGDQDRIHRRLRELTRVLHVSDDTRFKYTLGAATPKADTSKRLLAVVRRQAHLAVPVLNYLAKSPRLPRNVTDDAVALAREAWLYPSSRAALLSVLNVSAHPSALTALHRLALDLITTNAYADYPDLREATNAILLDHGLYAWRQAKTLVNRESDWWVRSRLVQHLPALQTTNDRLTRFANYLLRRAVHPVDAALVVAELIGANGLAVERPRDNISKVTQLTLRAQKVIGNVRAQDQTVSTAMGQVLGPAVAVIDWPRLLEPSYKEAISHVVRWSRYATMDPTAWINASDVVNDRIMAAVARHDPLAAGYQQGNMGGFIYTPPAAFAGKYAALLESLRLVHALRLESDLSHPVVRTTNKPTRAIRWEEMGLVKNRLRQGYVGMWHALGI